MTSKSQQKRIAVLKGKPVHVTTTDKAVEMRRICVWCNLWEREARDQQCQDVEGHLFRLAPVTADSREGT